MLLASENLNFELFVSLVFMGSQKKKSHERLFLISFDCQENVCAVIGSLLHLHIFGGKILRN